MNKGKRKKKENSTKMRFLDKGFVPLLNEILKQQETKKIFFEFPRKVIKPILLSQRPTDQ